MNTIKLLCLFLLSLITINTAHAERIEIIKYGDMDSWITRNIQESTIIGGKNKTIYAIGPTRTDNSGKAYTPAVGNPWATSNVMAKVCGVTKTSNAVSPGTHDGYGKCAVLTTKIERCKAIGIIDINVLVSGSIFLGRMIEPIKSTSNPYSKMEMGVPFTRRPKYLQFDYKLYNPGKGILTKANGTKVNTFAGSDEAEVFIILQQRWEDANGDIYAKRVGTGRERFSKTTGGWIDGHRIKVVYGDITRNEWYREYMGIIPEGRCYYARNSKGKMVPVHEIGWASSDSLPTHLLIMASSGCGTAYVGAVGMEFSIDNISLVF